MSHLISCNAGPDSTHSNIMDAQLCTFSLSVPGQRALTVTVSVSQTNWHWIKRLVWLTHWLSNDYRWSWKWLAGVWWLNCLIFISVLQISTSKHFRASKVSGCKWVRNRISSDFEKKKKKVKKGNLHTPPLINPFKVSINPCAKLFIHRIY